MPSAGFGGNFYRFAPDPLFAPAIASHVTDARNSGASQAWNFTSVKVNDQHVGAGFINGRFELKMCEGAGSGVLPGSRIIGNVNIETQNSFAGLVQLPACSALDGMVLGDGALTLHAGSVTLKSPAGQGHRLIKDRGGYLDFYGKDARTLQSHAWRLYVVIAADHATHWTSPRAQFAAFLMGTHPRLGARSMISQLRTGVLKIISSFVKRAPR